MAKKSASGSGSSSRASRVESTGAASHKFRDSYDLNVRDAGLNALETRISNELHKIASDVQDLKKLEQKYEYLDESLHQVNERLILLEKSNQTISEGVSKLSNLIFNGDNPSESILSQLTALKISNSYLDRGLAVIIGVAASVITALLIYGFQYGLLHFSTHDRSTLGSEVLDSPAVVVPDSSETSH